MVQSTALIIAATVAIVLAITIGYIYTYVSRRARRDYA